LAAKSGAAATGSSQRAGVARGAARAIHDEIRVPRTERGRRTQRALLDAAAAEFGEKGFHESSIVSITARAGIALGSFYTYFESKEALFRALVQDMSGRVRDLVAPAIAQTSGVMERERVALATFLAFAREHMEIYRIIDAAEFVAPEAWRRH
jgi:AcrR family transcriptional regulator